MQERDAIRASLQAAELKLQTALQCSKEASDQTGLGRQHGSWAESWSSLGMDVVVLALVAVQALVLFSHSSPVLSP